MTSTLQPLQTRSWVKSVTHTATEFAQTPLPIVSGTIPLGLRGSLYRNGPGRLERGGQRVGHWFDGDGAILGVHFTDAGATGVYRYVQTAGYQAEQQANKLIFAGYGMMPPGAYWERFKEVKNAANTSVLALPTKLLALWEGGKPYALDLHKLDTWGEDDLNGLKAAPYSAHPKRDFETGEIFNFGVALGKNGELHVYRSDSTGAIQQQTRITLDGLPLIHDFVVAGPYLIFFIPPVRMQPLPILARLKSFSDALTWRPELGTQVLVLDRATLEVVSRGETESWYQWHFGNGYVDTDGSVVVSVVRYEDFKTNQFLKEVATGETHTPAVGKLWQIRLDPQSGTVTETHLLLNRVCEFPTVQPQHVGQPARYTYLSLHRPEVDVTQELFGAIARYDHLTSNLMTADLGEQRYPTEPIYAPDRDHPDRGWLLTVVFDGNLDRSEVWIYEADRLDAEPVCKLALPTIIPLGFHGTWRS